MKLFEANESQNMHEKTVDISTKIAGFSFASLFLTNVAAWYLGTQTAFADPSPAAASTTSDSTREDASKQGAEHSEIGLVQDALKQIKTLKSIQDAGKKKQELTVAKSVLAKLDKYLIDTFTQPKFAKGMPPEVLTSAKHNDADPLCAFITREVAQEPGLENIKNLISIRNNLKSMCTSLSKFQ